MVRTFSHINRTIHGKYFFYICVVCGLCSHVIYAEDRRSVNINLEDGAVVEGVNTNPYNSVLQVSKKIQIDSQKLYQLKPHYKVEVSDILKKIGYAR